MKKYSMMIAALLAVAVAHASAAPETEIEKNRFPEGAKLFGEECRTSDDKYIFVPHMIGRYWLPVTMLDRGWCHNSALSVFDGATGCYINTVLLDDPDLGACEPKSVAADEKTIAVAHCGSSEISIIDRAAFEKRMAERKDKDLSTDMSFMAGIRRRIKTPKQGPQKIKLVDGKPVVLEYLEDRPGITKGELLFNDARLCYQQWHSCGTCHPGGKSDGQPWAFPRKSRFNHPEVSCDLEKLEMSDAQIDERMKRSVAPSLFSEVDSEVVAAMTEYVHSVRGKNAPMAGQ